MVYRVGELMDTQVLHWIEDLDKADITVRQLARRRLIAYEGDISDLMIDLMCEQQGRRSWEAAIILSERRDERAVGAMKRMLTSRHPVLGQVAAEALAAYGTKHIEALLEALPNSTYLTQIAIIGVLERIRDRRAVLTLMQFLPTVQQQVLMYTTIHALGLLGDPQAAAVVRGYINHDDTHVAKHARMAMQLLDAAQQNQ